MIDIRGAGDLLAPRVEARVLIYLIRNTKNGKCYVGQTTRSLDARWHQHCQLQGKCRALENAIRKYGIEAFEISEVAKVKTQEELNRLEALTCKALNTYSPHGYNLREGGGAKGKMHEETKRLISDLALSPQRLAAFKAMQARPDVQAKLTAARRKHGAARAAQMRAGVTPESEAKRLAKTKATVQSPEFRAAQGERSKRQHTDPEVKAKQRAAIKAKYDAMTAEQREERRLAMKQWLKGKKKTVDQSDEAKAKRSAIKAALWADPEHRAKVLARNSDPEVVKRRGDAIRAGHARRRAAQTASDDEADKT